MQYVYIIRMYCTTIVESTYSTVMNIVHYSLADNDDREPSKTALGIDVAVLVLARL
jgi:hypothetical protein